MNSFTHNQGLQLVAPPTVPVLDAAFRPAVLANRVFRDAAAKDPIPVSIALERSPQSVSRFDTIVAGPRASASAGNFVYLERLVKFLLWSRGGGRILFAGPADLGQRLASHFRDTSTGRFDAWLMGDKVYERPFEVIVTPPDRMPPACEITAPLGRHWDGCRIGFDLGASDRKVAAVKEGQVIFSNETAWNPKSFTDPRQHFDGIMDSLQQAAAHLPRVDAIGGSSAGVYVDNLVKVASLFRGISEKLFEQRIKPLFRELRKAWNGVPFEVVNDGEVTALAGAMSLKDNAVLGIAMGSSLAAGYCTRDGNITSWLNELAFAPVDYNPGAAPDEWSGDRGCGVQYFSQQAVGRLIPAAGIEMDATLPLPDKLVKVQKLMSKGDERAAKIYETIGVFLGYTIPHYAEFYDLKHVLVLGRVTTGMGGDLILEKARAILRIEFPELASKLALHTLDEKEKRHGQAMAAASLPVIAKP